MERKTATLLLLDNEFKLFLPVPDLASRKNVRFVALIDMKRSVLFVRRCIVRLANDLIIRYERMKLAAVGTPYVVLLSLDHRFSGGKKQKKKFSFTTAASAAISSPR